MNLKCKIRHKPELKKTVVYGFMIKKEKRCRRCNEFISVELEKKGDKYVL